jgi:hypothetical protein
MDIFIKLAPRDYDRLRRQVPSSSIAHKALAMATPIDHALEGVQFAGYSIPCNEDQARSILEIARLCCPGIIRDIEDAIKLARPES